MSSCNCEQWMNWEVMAFWWSQVFSFVSFLLVLTPPCVSSLLVQNYLKFKYFLFCKCKPCVFVFVWSWYESHHLLCFFSLHPSPPLAFLISSCEQVAWSSCVSSLTSCKCKPCAFVFFCSWFKPPLPDFFFSINDLFKKKCFFECSLTNVLKPMWFNEL